MRPYSSLFGVRRGTENHRGEDELTFTAIVLEFSQLPTYLPGLCAYSWEPLQILCEIRHLNKKCIFLARKLCELLLARCPESGQFSLQLAGMPPCCLVGEPQPQPDHPNASEMLRTSEGGRDRQTKSSQNQRVAYQRYLW